MSAGLDGQLARRLAALADPTGLTLVDRTSGAVIGRADIAGLPCVVFATDGSRQGGALSGDDSRLIAQAIYKAVPDGLPVIGLWHSGGAQAQEGVGALDGMGALFTASTAASGLVPQISVVVGTSAGGAAYGPALTDVVVTAPEGRLFVTGPGVIKQVTGDDVTLDELGGHDVHSRQSGLVHVAAQTEADALSTVRDLVGLLGRPCTPGASPPLEPWFRSALPDRRRRAYDVRPLVSALLDEGTTVELHEHWAPNAVTTLGRLGGRSVGVLANNPLRMAGCLDGRASDKAARFIRMCDSLGLPLVLVVDTPGYLPGVGQERSAIVRRGAKLLHAYAEARVPRVTLITRKAYGGAYIAMGSRALGADAVLAWPTAEVAVMGAEAAVNVVHRRQLAGASDDERLALTERLVAEQRATDSLDAVVALGVIDRVIDPAESRTEIARLLGSLPPARGRHGNIQL